MPLRAAQLFVRCRSLEELGEALGRVPVPHPVIALHQGEWGTVVANAADSALAQRLSTRFGTALALELDGGALALSVQTWEGGIAGEAERDPQPPHFRDVEAVAWELLDYLAVPAALRLFSLDDLEMADNGVPALLVHEKHRSQIFVLPPPRTEGVIPVQPDVVVESRAGESRALEVRDLPGGIPAEAWAEALADIEEAQALRLLRALADGDGPRIPRPTFTYRSLQALRVEKLMAAARRARPWLSALFDPEREPPLTRAGFTRLCREKLRDAPVARAHGRHLELWAGDACLRAPVDELYERSLRTLDADAAATELARRALELLQAPAGTGGELLPTLVAGDPGDRAVRALGRGLCAALLSDDGVFIAPVRRTGLPLDDAFEEAIARVDALTDASPEGLRWFDLEDGRVVVCDFADPAGAGRLLSAHCRGLILAILGADEALAAAPTRDALLACDATNAEAAAWLAEEAEARYREGPFPIHPGLWRMTLERIEPVAEGEPGLSRGGEPE